NLGRILGRADTAKLPLHGEGVALPDAHQTTDGSRGWNRTFLRAHRAPRPLTEARPRAVAAAGDVQARRRPARIRARCVSARPSLLRVPARELVRRAGVRVVALPRCGARDRRPARGEGVSSARVHGRLDLRSLSLW